MDDSGPLGPVRAYPPRMPVSGAIRWEANGTETTTQVEMMAVRKSDGVRSLPDRYLAPKELADVLGVPVQTLYLWRCEGERLAAFVSLGTCATTATRFWRGSTGRPSKGWRKWRALTSGMGSGVLAG